MVKADFATAAGGQRQAVPQHVELPLGHRLRTGVGFGRTLPAVQFPHADGEPNRAVLVRQLGQCLVQPA